jgi:uncharacterized membrane protein YccC
MRISLPLYELLRPIPGAVLRELRSISVHGPRAREALAAILAVYLAVTLAVLLQLDDLVWAAFSAFMVTRAQVRETLLRGMNRIAGTLCGAAGGMLLAPLAADNPLVLIAGLFVISWIGVFGSLVSSSQSYAWVFVGITGGLVLTEALAAPDTIARFTLTRILEVTVGTAASLLITCLFSKAEVSAPHGPPAAITVHTGRPDGVRIFQEQWLRERWPLIMHATRAALAVAALPLVWRWFGIQNFSQTAVTSYVLMIVPPTLARAGRPRPVYERAAHRMLGCLLGSVAAIVCIGLFGESVLAMLLAAGLAIWIGDHIQSGSEGIGYLGTQFTLGFLITLVQGPGPAQSILPGLERLLGIVIGGALLYLMWLIWGRGHDE